MAFKGEDYKYYHPCATKEPHVYPGYTGYLPGSGPKRILQMAETYGHMSYNSFTNHPIGGHRLAPILDCSKQRKKELQDQYYIWKHENMTKDVKLKSLITLGYTGYIPRKEFHFGKRYMTEVKDCIAEFERYQEFQLTDHKPFVPLPTEESTRKKVIYRPRVYDYDTELVIPAYPGFPENKNFDVPYLDRKDLDFPKECYEKDMTKFRDERVNDTRPVIPHCDTGDYPHTIAKIPFTTEQPSVGDWRGNSLLRYTDEELLFLETDNERDVAHEAINADFHPRSIFEGGPCDFIAAPPPIPRERAPSWGKFSDMQM